MSLVTRSVPSLHGGVSQQSPQVRSPDQLESLTNGWPSIANGLSKRAPTEIVARLMQTAPTNAHVHTINRDTTEQYVVIIADGQIKVFDTLTGQEQTVYAPGGWDYLSTITDFSTDISAFSVADYTFITNRKVRCAMSAPGADTQPDQTYQIWLNRRIGTDENGDPFAPGWAYQYPPNPTGGYITGTVQRFDKLPPVNQGDTPPPEGAIYRVQGDETGGFMSYYVVRRGGVWEECVKPGLVNALDAKTMPHALVRDPDGVFTFAPFSWAPRRVGDTDINPNPGFIGRPIRKVFFYQNRLSFLYDENCVMSCVGDFGNFWRMSQTDYLDSDVIDVGATSTRVSPLLDATTHNDGILLTSDQTQFSLSNGELGLTATSLAIRPTTNYTVNTTAGLAPLGSEIYFAVENSGFAKVMEYTRLAGADTTSASDVTAHCDRYIPAGVHDLIPADDLSALFVLTHGAPNKVYCYNFYWASSDEKLQSAWHEWDFGAGVLVVSGAYLKGNLFLTVERNDGLWLEKIDLNGWAKPADAPHQIHLDRRTTVTGLYQPTPNTTQFVLPYRPVKARFQIIRGNAFMARPETLIDPSTYVWITDNIVEVPASEIAGPVIVGEGYEFSFEFSTQFMRTQRGEAITTGRTTLRTFTVSFVQTAYFKTSVAPYGTNPNVEEILPAKLSQFTGKTLGASSFRLNSPTYATGTHRFQVYGQNTTTRIRIVNDTYAASTFIGAEWEANYYNRSRT